MRLYGHSRGRLSGSTPAAPCFDPSRPTRHGARFADTRADSGPRGRILRCSCGGPGGGADRRPLIDRIRKTR